MTERAVRVLVVDDQRLVREGIASLLGVQPGVAVVGTAADGQEAVARALELSPDVVLMDVRMPVLDGVAAVAELRRRAPACRVLMLTTFDDEEYVVQALAAGAAGYLLKDLPARELADAVRLAEAGVSSFGSAVTARLAAVVARSGAQARTAGLPENASGRSGATGGSGAAGGSRGAGGSGAAGAAGVEDGPLTGRERDVLRLVAGGATNREIAAQLYLSEGTVKNHVSRILARLGLRDRTQAAVYARDRGLG